jgi:5-methylcytosine-specific restriction endonuclease McrA
MNRAAMRASLIAAQKGRCCWCGLSMDRTGKGGRGATLDHIVPLAKGGPDIEANLTAACRTCNAARGDMDAAAFRTARTGHPGRGLPPVTRRSKPKRFQPAK